MAKGNERPLAGPGTIVGSNVVLTGTLKDMGDIALHGTVEGEVFSERSVIVGETAQVKGPVSGQVVTLAGTIRGAIEASQKLEILPSGKVFGSISTRELIVRSGAIFVGKCTMPVEEATSEPEEKEDSPAFESVGSRVAEREEED